MCSKNVQHGLCIFHILVLFLIHETKLIVSPAFYLKFLQVDFSNDIKFICYLKIIKFPSTLRHLTHLQLTVLVLQPSSLLPRFTLSLLSSASFPAEGSNFFFFFFFHGLKKKKKISDKPTVLYRPSTIQQMNKASY